MCQFDTLLDHFRVMDPSMFSTYCAYEEPATDDPEEKLNNCEGRKKLMPSDQEAMRCVLEAICKVKDAVVSTALVSTEPDSSVPVVPPRQPAKPPRPRYIRPKTVGSSLVSGEASSSELPSADAEFDFDDE